MPLRFLFEPGPAARSPAAGSPPRWQTALGGGNDAFATKLNATGTALAFSTYLGDTGDDFGTGIAVDAATT